MAAPTVTPGQTLGHFRLIEEIGAGGFGIIYRASDTRLQRDVAIKVLNPKRLNDESARKRFRREALILSRLNHPNIEAVYDFHSEQGIDYLVMEHVPGVSLDERLEKGPLPERELLEVGIQLARGLAAAHAQKIIHRDLKPGNLKVTPDNVLKILDFGLAQLFALPEDETVAETVTAQSPAAGTPAYLSPEQLEGKEPDTKSDIYSAGAVLYELATTSRPFPYKGQMLADAILHSLPPDPRLKNKDISPSLGAVILKCLEKDPELRYQSATELLDDLKETARGSGPQRPVAVQQDSKSTFKRWLLVTLVLIATATGVVLWRKLASQPPPPRISVVVAEFENRTGDPVFDQTPRELMSTALGQPQQVSVFPSSRLPDVLRRMQKPETVTIDENIGRDICTREGLQSVISGSVSRLGSIYLLQARVSDCKGDLIVNTQKEFSRPDELPSAIEDVTKTIRRKWGESKTAINQASQPLASATSGSLEALKLYSSGKQQLYFGNPRAAVSLFTKAVELDDSFAMAHEYLGIAYEHLGNDDGAGEEYARAAQLSSRVTEREREKILGDYALFQYDITKAISHYQVLAALSPEDPAVHLNLAECYRDQFRFDLAISEAKKATILTSSLAAENNLATYYYLGGDSQSAMTLAQQALKENPGNAEALNLISSNYLAIGKESEADGIWRQMLALGGDAASKARAAMCDAAQTRDNLKEAVSQLEYGVLAEAEMENATRMSKKQILLTELSWASGDRTSLKSLKKLQEPFDPELIFLLGRLYARSGRIDDAHRQLHRLEQLTDETPIVISFSKMLQSEIAATEGRLSAAVQSAKLGVQHLNSPLAIETLARAYELAGEREDAAHQYEILISRSNERQIDSVDSPALHAVVAAHYRLGVLYQALGRDDLAKEQFNSFLTHGVDKERTGPLFEDARRRVGQLKLKNATLADQRPLRTKSTH